MRTSRTNFITFLAFVLALFFTQLPSAQAATFTWTGAGTTNNFSDAANWGGTAPTGVATDALVFAGTTRLAPNNDITGGTFASIKFNAGSGAFTIAGNAFTMAAAGGINNSSTALQTISTAIAATAAMPIVMTTGGGSVTLNTGVISGTGGGFTTSGSGTLTLAGANTCTGASTVGTGTIVRVTAATGLGAAAAVVTVSAGGELAIGAAVTVANPMNLNGAGVSGSALTVSSTATLSGAMVFQTATTVSVAAGITATVSGATTATGNVTKIGTGTMLLSAAGVIATGTLTINAGTFTVNGTALWNGGNITVNTGGTMQCTGAGTNSIKDTATITVASGGIFDFNQTGTETIGGLTLNGVGSGAGAMINSTNTAGGLITGGVTLGSATTINSGTGTLQFASAFVGGFALTKIGTGTLTLRNANAATSLTILAGTFNGGGGTGTAGVNYYGTGPITLGDSANPTVAATLTLQSNNTLTFPNAIITGTNMTGLLSFLDPSGANVTWNGPITLNNSSLSITNTNGQANSIINFTGGVTGTGNLTLNGSGNGAPITFSGATVNNIGTITNAGNNLGGVVSINSVIGTNVTGITQNSVNSPLILGGNNTTTAPVTVTAGNLYVSSTGTVLGAVNVTAANLAGAGAINGAVTLAGTTPSITPGDLTLNGNTANGNTIGTLSVANNVTFSTPGALTFQLGATNDKIVVSGAGNMVFGTSGTINLAAANGFNPATTYTIVDTTTGTGTISGASTLTFTMPGYTFVTNQATATNTLTVGPFTPATNQLTWVGGNGNDMATATNWNPAKAPNDPSGPFELIFSVTNPGVLINTLPAGTRVLALTFNASGYTLTGNQLTVLANATSTLAPFGTGVAVANGFSATINAPLTLSSVTADMAVGVGSLLTISGVVSSAGIAGVQLTKSGAGALTLSGANTITNGFTMNAGTLNINNAAALSAAAVGSPIGTFTYNGGTLDNTSGSAITVTANASLVLNADVVFAGTNNLTFSGTVPLNATRNFTVNANALGLAGIISGTGFGITKLGLGTLTLGAVTNTYTGVTTINNGVLSVSTTLCLSSTTNPAIVIAGGSAAQPATLSYTGGGALSLAASRNIQLGTVSNANIIDVSNAAGTLQVDTTTFVMSGGMASPGVAFIKTGPGAFASNNGNATSLPAAFVGDIRVLNGRLTSTQSSTTVANTQLFGNGTIFLGDTTGTNSTSLNITGTLTGLFGNTMLANVNVVAGNTGTSSLVCTNTGSSYQVKGNIVMNKDLTILGPSTNTAAATIFTHAGTLTGTGILTVKNNGNTTASTESFNFNSASAFAGSFNVAVGTTGNTYITQLQLGATNSFPPTCTIALNGTGTRFNTNGFSNTVGSITGAAGSIISNNNAATASTLTIGNDNTSYTYAGTVIDGGVGVLNLATTGSGTIQFSGVNTYTGTTVVGGTGALFLNGAETTTGVHSVNTGAALGGSGSTTGTVVSSATSGIIPGTPTATGTFKTAGLTLNAASVVNFRLTGLSAGTGTLALAGNDTIDLSAQAAPAIVGTFNISGLQGLSAAPNNRYRMFVTTGAAPTVGAVTLNMPAGYTGSLVVAGLAVELIVSPSATQFTWSGGGGSGDMSVGANWVGGVAPTDATADLVFPASGANQAALINNLATAAVNSMTFTGGTYTISTGTQTSISLPASNALFTPLSVPAGTHSINTNLVFAAPTAGNGISVASGAILNLGQVGTTTITTTTLLTINSPGTTVVNSAITGVALTFPNTSTGTVTLAGSNALLTGAVTLNAGTLKTSNVGALGTTGPLTVANGATWDLAGAVGTISVPATLSGTGVGGVGVLINTVNSTPTLSATMTLGSIPTAITINNGVTTFTGNIAGGGSALALGGTGNISVNGIIDANVTTVTKTATGSVTLAGNNTYTGITTISAGVLVMGHASALGTTAAGTVISSGGALDLNGFTLSTESLTIAGVGGTSLGAIINTNATPAVVTGPITLTAASTIYNNNTGGITLGTITNATFAVTVDGGGPTNFAGVVSGTGGLVKTGTGTLTLSAVNTFTGAVTVSKGTLAMGIDNALVPTSAVTVNADATAGGNTVLDFATFGGTIASLITICDNPGNANVINVGNLTIATTLVLGRHVTAAINLNSSTLTLAAGKTINIGSGTTSVMTLGDYITLAAASGTVTSTFDASLGAGVNINVGSLLLGNSVITTGNVLLPSTLILPTSTTSSCSITASTTVQLGKTAGLGMNYSETLVFGGGVNVLTTPILLIGGSKLTTANVSIANGGTLNMVGTTSIQVADQTNAAATGTLSTCSFDMTGGTLIAPGLSTVVVGKYVGAGTGGANGTLNFGTSALTNVTMTSLSAGQETTGAQTGNTSQGTVIIGGGTVRLGTVNLGSSFTGTTVQVTGRLNINGGSVFSGNIVMGTATGTAVPSTIGQVDLNGGTLNVTGILSKGTATTATIANVNFNGGTLQAGASSATFMTGLTAATVLGGGVTIDTNGFSITITQPLVTSGSAGEALTKAGAGTLTLIGVNTYVGATTINAGVLALSGVIAGSVTAAGTSTLQGTGTIGGALSMGSGTTLSPGIGGTGTLSINANTVLNTVNLNYDLGLPGSGAVGGAFNDYVTSTGTFNLDLGATPSAITIVPQPGFGVGTYTLMSPYASVLNPTSVPTINTLPGVTMAAAVTGNALVLNVTAIATSATRVTWTGGAGDHLWSTAANWSNAPTGITSGGPYELYFPNAPTSTDFLSNDDIAALTIHSIVIESATAYTIGTTGAGTTGTLTIDGNGTNLGTAVNVISGSHAVGTAPMVWTTQNQTINVVTGGLALTNNISNGAFNTLINNGVDLTYGGILGNGAGGLLKAGSGKLTLTGTNTYLGSSTIGSGTVSIAAPVNLGAGAAANSIIFPVNSFGILQLTSTQTSASKGILLSGNGTIDIPNAADTWTLSAATNVISGAGGLAKIGAGTLVMSQANTFAGAVTVNAGTFTIGNATALGPVATAALAFGPNSTGLVRLNALNVTVNALNTSSPVGTPIIENGGAAASILTVSPGALFTNSTFAGTLRNGGGAGTLALTKNGNPTLTLSGTNTQT
ncbi:MAG: autotransporter-associated beta strand repeat-containing protein, partial [Planctomycetota bacterium]